MQGNAVVSFLRVTGTVDPVQGFELRVKNRINQIINHLRPRSPPSCLDRTARQCPAGLSRTRL